MEIFLVLLIKGAIALICYSIAQSKGRSGITWAILGLIFSLVALIVVALLPRIPETTKADQNLSAVPAAQGTFDRQRWNALLESNAEVAAAAARLAPLGNHSVDALAVRYLAGGENESIHAIVESILQDHKSIDEVMARPADFDHLDRQVAHVYVTPWGGIVVLRDGAGAVVLKGQDSEVLQELVHYHEKYPREDTAKWQEVTDEKERRKLVMGAATVLASQRPPLPSAGADKATEKDRAGAIGRSHRFHVSYRFDEAEQGQEMAERLSRRFGADSVQTVVEEQLQGVRGVELRGANLQKTLPERFAVGDVLLVIMGNNWLGRLNAMKASGTHDPVHEAIVAALTNSALVVPVLIEPAKLPRSSDLPADIRPMVLDQMYNAGAKRSGPDLATLVSAIGR